jgi:hypothetical protein
MPSAVAGTASTHNAPGLLAGIEFQFLRALDWLARAPAEARIGLETGDDVVVESPSGGPRVSEQDKNSTKSSGHPFTDRSTALWKTLAIWARLVQEGKYTKDTVFLLVTNRPVPQCFARSISDAADTASIAFCVDQILQTAANPPEALAPFCSTLINVGRESLAELVARVHLCDGTQLLLDEHIAQIASHLHFPPTVGDPRLLVDALSGWLHRQCLELWRNGESAWIERTHFDRQYHAVLSQTRRDRTSERAASLIPLDSKELTSARARTFVRQLLLVDTEDPDIDDAVAAYLRFGTERLRLIEIGDITEVDWETFFANLTERWKRISRSCIRDMTPADETAIGRTILRQTVEQGFKAELAGRQTSTEYFTNGGYHRLADDSSVWWHPTYSKLSSKE